MLGNQCELDLGMHDVTLAADGRLSGAFSVVYDFAWFTIKARSFTVHGSIVGDGGGWLFFTVTDDFRIETDGKINVDGNMGKLVVDAGGSVALHSASQVSADGTDGEIDIAAGDDVVATAELSADSNSSGGSINISAARGSIESAGPIHANAGGYVGFVAAGNVTIGGLVRAQNSANDDGGSIDVDANGGDVRIEHGMSVDGGNGGTISITAAGSALVTGDALTADGTSGGDGGGIGIKGSGGVTIDADLSARSSGSDSSGGDISVEADPHAAITVNAGRTLAVTTTANGGQNGDISLALPAIPCRIVVAGTLDAHGGAGSGRISVQYRDSFDATGATVVADPGPVGGNFIACRCVDPDDDGVCDGGCVHDPVVVGAVIDPPFQLTPRPLGDCTGCHNGVIEAGEGCDDGNFADGDCCSSDCQPEPAGGTCAGDGNVCTDDRCNGLGACEHVANSAPCDDHDPCTTMDQCSGGFCRRGSSVPCCAEPCTPTPSASSTPTVTATPSPSPTPTPNDVASTTPSGTPIVTSTATPTSAPLDHFTCYTTSTTSGSVRFPGIPDPPGIALVDQFGASTVAVKKTGLVCAPTATLGDDADAPSHPEHLKGYRTKNHLHPALPTRITVVDRFNPDGLVVDAKKQSHLLVPAVKSLSTTPPTPPAFGTDHFECYKITVAAAVTRFLAVADVTLEDQFGAMTVDVKRPRYLCNPADKNHESPGAEGHATHLMCYAIKQTDAVKFVQRRGVFLNDQFGPETLDVRKPTQLCVPALTVP